MQFKPIIHTLFPLFNSRWWQCSLQFSHCVSSLLKALRRRQENPFVSFRIILRHALSSDVTEAQLELGIGIILFSRFAIPFYRLHFVLRHTLTTLVADAQIELRLS